VVRPGDIIEFNSCVLAAQVNEWGGQAHRFPISEDDFGIISQAVRDAASGNDLILLNAGASAGSEDFSAQVIEAMGSVLVHGVAVRPGHPVILGMIRSIDSKMIPIIGVPGYPVSAALTGEIFVEPLLARWEGRAPLQRPLVSATLTRKVNSPPGDDDYLRVSVAKVGEKILAAPLPRGAGMITSLVHADGVTIIPRGSQGLEAGSTVSVRLYHSAVEIENTIFAIGSHDLTLDLLAQYLSNYDRRLASVNVGSQGGLMALKRGEAHFAGSHLLDPTTGEYNLSYIRQYLLGIPVTVLGWVGRKQGLCVRKGNPKQIHSLQDLARPDVTFVNRQRGAGTRVLLDYHLAQMGIGAESVHGYQQEEYTHLAVAAAVSSGRADCGLGIAAAAEALDLDFIPLFDERYELVIPRVFLDSALLAPLFILAHDDGFRQAILALPGYDVSQMGVRITDIS
jgi:putative molybdopterin biosynthesis protein